MCSNMRAVSLVAGTSTKVATRQRPRERLSARAERTRTDWRAASCAWPRTSSVLGPPIEAAIALSIVLVAVQIVNVRRGMPSFTTRRPWLVAFCFGLLHGFGFAGALAEVGSPHQAIPIALLFFNIGVELGQLALVAVVLLAGGTFPRFRDASSKSGFGRCCERSRRHRDCLRNRHRRVLLVH